MATSSPYCAYHDTDSFRAFCSSLYKPSKYFSFFHLNAQSLRNKEEELSLLLSSLDKQFEVLAFTETWFSSTSDITVIDGYHCEAICRTKKKGGGVAIYLHNKYSYDVLHDYCIVDPNFESLFIKTSAFIVGVIYRPPSGSLSQFYLFLEPVLEFISNSKTTAVILGDFNVNLLHVSDLNREFCDMLSVNGFANVIDIPTRVTPSSQTLIDLCLTNFDRSDIRAGVLTSDLSDHLSAFYFVPKRSTILRVKAVTEQSYAN